MRNLYYQNQLSKRSYVICSVEWAYTFSISVTLKTQAIWPQTDVCHCQNKKLKILIWPLLLELYFHPTSNRPNEENSNSLDQHCKGVDKLYKRICAVMKHLKSAMKVGMGAMQIDWREIITGTFKV